MASIPLKDQIIKYLEANTTDFDLNQAERTADQIIAIVLQHLDGVQLTLPNASDD